MAINISTPEAVFPWKPASWLRVSGEDAFTFLQGQFTNDLRLLDDSPAVYGLWLTVKGKVLADSFVLRGREQNEFWIGSYFSPSPTIRERLESHVIADDVSIEDFTSEWAGMSIFGSGTIAAGVSELAPGGFGFPGRRGRDPVTEWIYPRTAGEPIGSQFADVAVLDDQEMTRRRIAAGIPAIPIDVGPADLPNEAGLEADAISYVKGCYLGQEVMARLKSIGQVRRRMWRVHGSGTPPPSRPLPVFAKARQVGELRSAVGDGDDRWIGLAMVSLMHVGPGSALGFTAEGPADLWLNAEP
jgi:folate-binding protein YgfZ